jgi:hypothetical protein
MSHAVRRQLITAAVAASSIALVAAPSAGAATKKISSAEKKQNTAIKKNTTAVKKAQKTATSAGKTAKQAGKDATKGIADAKTAAGKADAAAGTANGILGQVPAVLDGLTKLAAGLTAAGDGLKTLGAAFAAQEYGTVKLQLGTTDVPGAILNSSDIPDDGNAAIVTGSVLVPLPAGLPATAIHALAGVRSGEADGTGDANPVASAGIVSLTVTSPTGAAITGGNTGIPNSPITSAPNGTDPATSPPVYPIPNKAPRSDATPNPFSFPTDKAIDLTDPAKLYNISGLGANPFSVANPGGTPGLAVVTFTVRFNDLTASATDVTA